MPAVVVWLECPLMSANVSIRNCIAEDLAMAFDSAPDKASGKGTPGSLQLRVAAEIEDSLALLRTAVLLARHYGATLIVVLPEAGTRRNGSANSTMEVHLGAAPCTAMLTALLSTVEQQLRSLSSGMHRNFFVELGFPADSRGFLLRIRSAGPPPPHSIQCQSITAERFAVSKSHPSK